MKNYVSIALLKVREWYSKFERYAYRRMHYRASRALGTIHDWCLASELAIPLEIHDCAEAAYKFHVASFGQPEDSVLRYEISAAHHAFCTFDRWSRTYLLTFRAADRDRRDRLHSTAHEMYHRVTSSKKPMGLHRYVWVDEMLAFLAARKYMQHNGYPVYAREELKKCYRIRHRMAIGAMKRACRKPLLASLFYPFYPDYFGSSIAILAVSIEALVGWNQLCRLVHCATWQEWLREIPHGNRETISAIIEEFETPIDSPTAAQRDRLQRLFRFRCRTAESTIEERDIREILEQEYARTTYLRIPQERQESGSTQTASPMERYAKSAERGKTSPIRRRLQCRTGTNDMAALLAAARKGNSGIVAALIVSCVPVDAADKCGRNALMYASGWGRHDIVKMLLARGANTLLRDKEGMTALDYAKKYRHSEIARMLQPAVPTGYDASQYAMEPSIRPDDDIRREFGPPEIRGKYRGETAWANSPFGPMGGVLMNTGHPHGRNHREG